MSLRKVRYEVESIEVAMHEVNFINLA